MNKPVLIIILIIFGSITYAAPSRQTTFYVAPDGSDRNPGTTERPLASLAGARDALRETGLLGRESLEVIFRAALHRRHKGFLPQDDSDASQRVVFFR